MRCPLSASPRPLYARAERGSSLIAARSSVMASVKVSLKPQGFGEFRPERRRVVSEQRLPELVFRVLRFRRVDEQIAHHLVGVRRVGRESQRGISQLLRAVASFSRRRASSDGALLSAREGR